MLNSFVIGRCMVMMPKWDATEALRLIEKEKITYFVGVPTMSLELMNHPDRHKYDLSSLKDITAGGAPRPVSHVERLQEAFPDAQPALGYGLTETNATGCANFWTSYAAKPASTGRAQSRWSKSPSWARATAICRRVKSGKSASAGRQYQGLLAQPGSDRCSLHRGRLSAHRRCRLSRRGRLSVHRRPQEGNHHPRRREYLDGGGRGRMLCLPGRRRSRGVWSARRAAGRGPRRGDLLKDGER